MPRKPRYETQEVLAKKKEMAAIVGRNLKRLRLQKEITQEDMADLLDIKASTVSRIERGEIMLSLSHIAKLCVDYGLDFVYFFRRDNPSFEAGSGTESMLGFVPPGLQERLEQSIKDGDEAILQKLLQEMETIMRFFLFKARVSQEKETKNNLEENGGAE